MAVFMNVDCCIELRREVHKLINVSPQSLMSEAQDAKSHMPLCPTGLRLHGKRPFIQIDFPFLLI